MQMFRREDRAHGAFGRNVGDLIRPRQKPLRELTSQFAQRGPEMKVADSLATIGAGPAPSFGEAVSDQPVCDGGSHVEWCATGATEPTQRSRR